MSCPAMHIEIHNTSLKRVILASLFAIVCFHGHAQINQSQVGRFYTEPIFVQYMSGMQHINPAYVGMWDRVGYQFFTRQDYVGQSGAPMMLYFSGYKPIMNSSHGAGINFSYERVGYENKLTIAADYAHEVKLNWKTFLRLGLKVGVINYDNDLSKYRTDLGPQIPDVALMVDIEQHFMLKWGVGLLLYTKDYYIGLSIPQIVANSYQADIANFSSVAEARDIYFLGGYFFGKDRQIRFKPTYKLRISFGENGSSALDLGFNWRFWDKFWLGGMYRTDGTFAIVSQAMLIKNTTIGYAVEFPLGTDIGKQLQTHEIRIAYEFDFFRRPHVRHAYF